MEDSSFISFNGRILFFSLMEESLWLAGLLKAGMAKPTNVFMEKNIFVCNGPRLLKAGMAEYIYLFIGGTYINLY
ncbi:MAG: hypothetical protein GX938_10355 [Spirochaetales bacterium]|nr:hypothetical protein [Spirochaetales bacterium]